MGDQRGARSVRCCQCGWGSEIVVRGELKTDTDGCGRAQEKERLMWKNELRERWLWGLPSELERERDGCRSEREGGIEKRGHHWYKG